MFEQYAGRLPLELFVLGGSFLEEIISPIPSFVVLVPAGAAAHVQGFGWWYLVVLAFIAAVGRIAASLILYFVADKAEDWLLSKGRRFFGVSHAQLENYGQRFSGTPRDLLVLFLLNALPILPTSLLSLTCGFIKVELRMFVIATYFGSAINAICYMAVGYAGVQAVAQFHSVESILQAISVALLVGLAGWLAGVLPPKEKRPVVRPLPRWLMRRLASDYRRKMLIITWMTLLLELLSARSMSALTFAFPPPL